LHVRSARDFLDALVALKLLERQETTTAIPGDGSLLDRAKPSYAGGLLEMANARLYESWGSLTEALVRATCTITTSGYIARQVDLVFSKRA